jgi:hypothetical protein
VEEDREEGFPTGKPPIVVGDDLERIGHLLSVSRRSDHFRKESGGED